MTPDSSIPEFPDFSPINSSMFGEIKKASVVSAPNTDTLLSCLLLWQDGRPNLVSRIGNRLLFKLPSGFGQKKESFIFGGPYDYSDLLITDLQKIIKTGQKVDNLPIKNKADIEKLASLLHATITENRDGAEYIYSASGLANYSTPEYASKRRRRRKFINNYANRYEESVQDGILPLQWSQVESLYADWAAYGTEGSHDSEPEKLAIKRIMTGELKDCCENFINILIMVDKKIAGFLIFEVISKDYATAHFIKTNLNLVGVTEYIFSLMGSTLVSRGILFSNHQDDLGISGLRNSKLTYHPVELYEKYNIEPKFS